MRRRLPFTIVLCLTATACAGPALAPTVRPEAATPTAVAPPSATPAAGAELLERPVTFRVQAPPETPAGDTVYLVLLPFYDWAEQQRIPMTRGDDGLWSAPAVVPQGGLIRYAYDRGWAPPDSSKATRERVDETLAVEFRFLHVSADVTEVRDIVARWNDVPAQPSTGAIRGTVRDVATGSPVWEATVSVAGVHAATHHDGYFELDGVPAGAQRVTVLADDGRHRVQARDVWVEPGGVAEVDFDLQPARQVAVTFRVQVPEDTPAWAAPRITGSIPQLGSWVWCLNGLWPSSLRPLSMTRSGPRQFEAEIVGYEGLLIQYAYTLGSLGVGTETNPDGTFRLRSILVAGESVTVTDDVSTWRGSGRILVEYRVRVPPNTPPGVPVLLVYGPPTAMHPIGPLEWGLPDYHSPGDGQNALAYGYALGTGLYGGEATQPDRMGLTRSITIPSQDIQQVDTVERWRWTPASTTAPPLAVDFYVAVPPETDSVYLLGDAAELGGGDPARAVGMTRMTESLWQARVAFDSPTTATYRFLRGAARVDDGRRRVVEVAYGGQQVLDWVTQWNDRPPPPVSPRPVFIAGIEVDDFWRDEFRPLWPSTLDRIQALGGEWVDVASWVASFGRLEPPLLENRSLRVGYPPPLDEMRFIAREVKARGMRLFIHPQVNAEMTPGVERLFEPRSTEWYEAYLPRFERYMLDAAALAEALDADMVAVPRGAFYGEFQDPAYEAVFNARMGEIITKMRSIYGGLITSEGGLGGPQRHDYHRLLDYIGVYWAEPPDVADDAPIEELQAAIEARLDGPYRDLYQQYGKPLIITGLAYGSFPGAARLGPGAEASGAEDQPVALDLAAQARLQEAFFRAIASRPWVVGVFPSAYHLLDLPLEREVSIRAKPAEAVTGRWYELLTP